MISLISQREKEDFRRMPRKHANQQYSKPKSCQKFGSLIKHRKVLAFERFVTRGKLSLTRVAMEKAMAPHSSTLAWQIPWMEVPGRLQSMGLLEVGHNWATSLPLFTLMHWRRKQQPTPVFLPGESQGRGRLVGCHLWGRTEPDVTEATQQQQQQQQYVKNI